MVEPWVHRRLANLPHASQARKQEILGSATSFGAGPSARALTGSPEDRYDPEFLGCYISAGRESNEANISAQPPSSSSHPWFPRSDGVEERPHRAQASPRQGPQAADGFFAIVHNRPQVTPRLKDPTPCHVAWAPGFGCARRSEFTRVQEQGRRVGTTHMTVLALPNALDCDRLGVIASRKLGGAVMRNRAKRRLRALFRQIWNRTRSGARGPSSARPCHHSSPRTDHERRSRNCGANCRRHSLEWTDRGGREDVEPRGLGPDPGVSIGPCPAGRRGLPLSSIVFGLRRGRHARARRLLWPVARASPRGPLSSLQCARDRSGSRPNGASDSVVGHRHGKARLRRDLAVVCGAGGLPGRVSASRADAAPSADRGSSAHRRALRRPAVAAAVLPGPPAAPAEAAPLVADATARDIVVETERFGRRFRPGAHPEELASQAYFEEGQPLELLPQEVPAPMERPFAMSSADPGVTAMLARRTLPAERRRVDLGDQPGQLTFEFTSAAGLNARKTFYFQPEGKPYVLKVEAVDRSGGRLAAGHGPFGSPAGPRVLGGRVAVPCPCAESTTLADRSSIWRQAQSLNRLGMKVRFSFSASKITISCTRRCRAPSAWSIEYQALSLRCARNHDERDARSDRLPRRRFRSDHAAVLHWPEGFRHAAGRAGASWCSRSTSACSA